jgi:hypothetical protein
MLFFFRRDFLISACLYVCAASFQNFSTRCFVDSPLLWLRFFSLVLVHFIPDSIEVASRGSFLALLAFFILLGCFKSRFLPYSFWFAYVFSALLHDLLPLILRNFDGLDAALYFGGCLILLRFGVFESSFFATVMQMLSMSAMMLLAFLFDCKYILFGFFFVGTVEARQFQSIIFGFGGGGFEE